MKENEKIENITYSTNNDCEDEKIKLNINLGGLCLSSNETPTIIIGGPIESEDDLQVFKLKISDDVKKHERMCYTTDIGTLKLILENMTIRSSSLSNANLNDKMEKERVGISQFAGARFITCFSHADHESVPFWANYGGKEKSKKVLLKFKNFSNCFMDAVYTDYCLINGNQKLFFYSDEYKQTININGIIGEALEMPKIHEDFDMRNCIRSTEIFDIEYLPSENKLFKENFSDKCDLDVSKFASKNSLKVIKGVPTYKTDCLGKQKSQPWDYERESRILSCLNQQDFSEWDYIDLRLKEEFFRNLVIVMNPWAENELKDIIMGIIRTSSLSEDIKSTISVEYSELHGTLNL